MALDQSEQALMQINSQTASEINLLRTQIIDSLDQYNRWRRRMREMEISFLANVLRPGYILKQATRQKSYLEKEYARIRAAIINGDYESIQALEVDIQRVLAYSEHAFEADERSFKDEQFQENVLLELAKNIDAQNFVEDKNEAQIIQSFKRTVLPAIHPDTSDTDQETFLTVFEAYTTEDFLLMEAYVVQYQGDLEIDDQDDPIKVQDSLSTNYADYQRLAGRLDRKLKSLQKDLTIEEIEEPDKLERHLKQQQEELRRLISIETQIIFDLRQKIEGLIQFFLDAKRKNSNGL